MITYKSNLTKKFEVYGSGHENKAIVLPGFAIIWTQNKVTKQPHIRDLAHMYPPEGNSSWILRHTWGID